jgi:hypothetical protein
MDVECLYGPISLATNRAEYGWARADLNHCIPGVPDAETELAVV